jgi:hypothetical protein
MRNILTLILIVLCMACTRAPDSEPPADAQALTMCPEQRPRACTREYRPVCASVDTGIRCITTPCPSAEWKTYGNACDACADPKVIGHQPGECGEAAANPSHVP